MRTGELICENTHAKFLNNLLKIHLHNYRQCTYKLNNGYVIWMIRLSGVESTTGWTNTLTDSGNTILEDYNLRQLNILKKLCRLSGCLISTNSAFHFFFGYQIPLCRIFQKIFQDFFRLNLHFFFRHNSLHLFSFIIS